MQSLALQVGPEMDSPMINGQLWPDNNGVHINAHGGHIINHHGTWYWYGEHKAEGWDGRLAWHGVHAYSSTDLTHWHDCDLVLRVVDDPKSPICKGCRIERPKVIFCELTGKFVMYFHSTDAGHTLARCGVAVADNPLGPFEFLYAERPEKGRWPLDVSDDDKNPASRSACPPETSLCNGENPETIRWNVLGRDFATGQMARDMTLFIDDDNAAYHVYASEHNSTLHISQLSEDYLTHTGVYNRAFKHRWMEAPVMFKRNGRYYLLMSGCTGWKPNAARGAYADHVFGPWTEFGNPCDGVNPDNGLGSDFTFGGQGACTFQIQGTQIIMLDLWNPESFIDSRYIWLPVIFENGGTFRLRFTHEWYFPVSLSGKSF